MGDTVKDIGKGVMVVTETTGNIRWSESLRRDAKNLRSLAAADREIVAGELVEGESGLSLVLADEIDAIATRVEKVAEFLECAHGK